MFLIFVIWCSVKVHSEEPKKFRFLNQPEPQTVEDGSLVSFNCSASNGLSPVTYTWYKMARVIMPPSEADELTTTNQTITVTVYKSDSRHLYQCSAESDGQIIFSDVAKVTISYFVFHGKSVDRFLTISDKENAVATSLACFQQVPLVTSDAPFSINWYKGATKVEDLSEARAWMSPTDSAVHIHIGEDSISTPPYELLSVKPYDLVLYNLRLTDSATYFCRAVQRNKMITLITWNLQVGQEFDRLTYMVANPVAGYITDNVNVAGNLINQVEVGKNVTLLCGAIGYCNMPNKLSYTWYRDGHVIGKGKSVNTLEGGKYDCAVKCGLEGVVKESSVTVPDPIDTTPTVNFTVLPPEYIGHILARTPDEIDIPCSIEDTARFRKNYYLNGKEVQVPMVVSQSSNPKSGVVQCSFVDKLTQTIWVQKTTQLTMIGKPSIEKVVPHEMSFGNELHVFPLESVTFSFKVKSLGPVKVTLLTDDAVNTVCEPGGRPLYPNERCSVADDTYSISIRRFTADNQRTYLLRADHEFYVPDSAEDGTFAKKSYTVISFVDLVRVEVCNTTLVRSPKLQVYSFGTSVTLTCTSEGYPTPVIQFYKNGVPLGLWESSCQKRLGSNTCQLVLSKYQNSGKYTCNVHNDIRGERRYCNTTSHSITFVGNPVATVELQDTADGLFATCTAEGNPSPRSVYWLNSRDQRIEPRVEIVSFFRKTSTLNVTDGPWPYYCCVQDQQMDFKFCKKVELEVEEYEVFNPNRPKGIDKMLVVCVVTGGILSIVFITLISVICCRRRRAQMCNNTQGTDGASLPLGKNSGAIKEGQKGKPVTTNGSASQTLLRVRPVSNPRYANNVT